MGWIFKRAVQAAVVTVVVRLVQYFMSSSGDRRPALGRGR